MQSQGLTVVRVKDRLARVLRNKPRVITRAVFWSIPHDSGREDIRLKLGRYKKPEDFMDDETPEILQPKSELTLDDEEFQALVNFLREHYSCFTNFRLPV
jgi:hypothetical protein